MFGIVVGGGGEGIGLWVVGCGEVCVGLDGVVLVVVSVVECIYFWLCNFGVGECLEFWGRGV